MYLRVLYPKCIPTRLLAASTDPTVQGGKQIMMLELSPTELSPEKESRRIAYNGTPSIILFTRPAVKLWLLLETEFTIPYLGWAHCTCSYLVKL